MPVLGTAAAASARGFGFSTQNTYSEQSFTSPGTYTFIVPAGVTSISMVAVGGGGATFKPGNYTGGNALPFTYNTPPGSGSGTYYAGGGGALAYKNNVSVTPGQTLTVVVGAGGAGLFVQAGEDGGDSYVEYSGTKYVHAGGGKGQGVGNGGTVIVGDGGGAGGKGGAWAVADAATGLIVGGGGGGAGGYSGAGGAGGGNNADGSAGSGGGAGGGGGGRTATGSTGFYNYVWYASGAAGGGTGLYGQGSSGAGGLKCAGASSSFTIPATGGDGGSSGNVGSEASPTIQDGGFNGDSPTFYGRFGGGGGAPGVRQRETISTGVIDYSQGRAGNGCFGGVRIIWASAASGITRAFPSTNVGPL
jgi:hypothetical protein